MKISIYVHDFQPQIGHSRALIELFNGLLPEQKEKISLIEVVAFTSAPLDEIFSNFICAKKFTKVPLSRLKPFLVKIIFYHLYTFLHSFLFARLHKKIGVGLACLNVDIVNVQFIHRQWDTQYFESTSLGIFKKIYKKCLYFYFSICEDFIYGSQNENIDYIVIANFMKIFLKKSFHTNESAMHLIPSGVNVTEFSFSSLSEKDLFNYLLNKYPILASLDPLRPISLFVGAYERKGLDVALKALSEVKDCQFIIIGKPEQFSDFVIPSSIKSFRIEFTDEVHLFYELADTFIFPTKYEPFGLVIIEAYVMGMDLVIPSINVGASEIIPQSDGIYFINPKEGIKLPAPIKISRVLKKERRIQRLKNIEQYSWTNASNVFYSILFKY